MLARWLNSLRAARRFRRDREGGVAVEFAFASLVLLILLSGAIDLGFALNQSAALENGARAGAQYAMSFPSDSAGIKDVVEKAVPYDSSTLTITSSVSCECSGTVVDCSTTCSGSAPATYVSVNVSKPYNSPLPTTMMLGISTLSGSATFRAN